MDQDQLALGAEFGNGPSLVAMMDGLAEDVRGGVIRGAGYYVAEERPNILAERLLTFFKEVDGGQEGE